MIVFFSIIRINRDFFSLFLGFEEIDKSRGISTHQIQNYCLDLFAYFNTKLVDALVKCTRTALDLLKKYADIKR